MGDAKNLNLRNGGVLVQKLLDLPRVNIFATANNHVFNTTDNTHVALFVHGGQVSGVKPPRFVNRLRRAFGVVPILTHYRISPGAYFSLLTHGHHTIGVIDNLDFYPGHSPAYGFSATLQRIVGECHMVERTHLCLTVANEDIFHVHLGNDALHDFYRTGCARHNARSQGREIKLAKPGVIELGNKHGGNTM